MISKERLNLALDYCAKNVLFDEHGRELTTISDTINDAISLLSSDTIVLVPRNPTAQMLSAGELREQDGAYTVYKTMVNLSPFDEKNQPWCEGYMENKDSNDCPGCNVCFDCPEKR